MHGVHGKSNISLSLVLQGICTTLVPGREEQEHEEHVRVPDQTARPSSLDRLGGSPHDACTLFAPAFFVILRID